MVLRYGYELRIKQRIHIYKNKIKICRITLIYIENELAILYTWNKCLSEQRVEYYCKIR